MLNEIKVNEAGRVFLPLLSPPSGPLFFLSQNTWDSPSKKESGNELGGYFLIGAGYAVPKCIDYGDVDWYREGDIVRRPRGIKARLECRRLNIEEMGNELPDGSGKEIGIWLVVGSF